MSGDVPIGEMGDDYFAFCLALTRSPGSDSGGSLFWGQLTLSRRSPRA